jgi:hypothetical protein
MSPVTAHGPEATLVLENWEKRETEAGTQQIIE